MSVEFWYRLGSYYLGIICVLALLFCLIEASRQFEHSRKWQPLVGASGFFFVIVAIILQTVLLDNEQYSLFITIAQIIGFVGISVGLHAHKPSESHASSELIKQKSTDVTPPVEATPATEGFDWVGLLSNPINNKSRKALHVTETEPVKTEPAAPSKTEIKAEPKATKKPDKTATVDLSYLANRTRKKKNAELPPESRDDMMNDLFPVEKKSKKAAVVPTALGMIGVTPIAPLIVLVTIASIILGLIPRIHKTGNRPILFGFSILLIVWLSRVIIDPLNLTDGMNLAIQAVEAIGFSFVGFGSWMKIKGEASHHFATILCCTTLGLMVITTVLGYYYVTQSDSLQLLLYFCTGVLIVIIPIIHATIFDHLPEKQADHE
jgi:hypothetical protein